MVIVGRAQKCAIRKLFSEYFFSHLPIDNKDQANQVPVVRPHSQDWTIKLLVSLNLFPKFNISIKP